MQMDSRIILAGQQPDFANALAGGVQAGQAMRQAQQQNALADLFKTQGAGIMSGDQNALNALAQISPQAAYDIMGQRQQMDARALDMQATRQRMDVLSAQEARQVEQYAASKTAAERAAEAAQIEDAVKMGMMIQSPEQWDQVMATQAPDLVGQFANRDALAGKYMTMAEILKQTQGDPAAATAGAPTGYMWTDPNDRTKGVAPITGYQAEPKDDYQRYTQEELQAGRKPLGRIEFEQAKKSKEGFSVTTPDGTTVNYGSAGGGMKLTEQQSKDLVYFERGSGAAPLVDKSEQAMLSMGQALASNIPGVGNYLLSPEYQKGRQAGNELLAAILRKDTGAAITKDEFALYGPMYLPMPGDGPEVLAQKRKSRKRALSAIKRGLGTAEIVAEEMLAQRAASEGEPDAQDQPQGQPELSDDDLLKKYGG